MTEKIPDWNTATSDKKFDLLHDWLTNISTKLEAQEREIQRLHERLRKLERLD